MSEYVDIILNVAPSYVDVIVENIIEKNTIVIEGGGGSTGQFLKKASNTNFDTVWGFIIDNDIPGLDWSKIITGKPTTIAGYGITDGFTGNSPITGATKTKITYDSKGLVTSGADATTADIASSTDKNYVSDAQVIILENTSGTNTGDQDLSPYVTIDDAAAAYSPIGHTHSFNSLTGKPTTLAGYGITDAYPLTGNPSGFLTSFSETDPVFLVSAAAGISATQVSNWDTAFGWGNHASAGYLTANQNISLSGDISGSGVTAIATTIGAGKVTNTMLAGSIDLTTKVTGLLPDGNIASALTWNAKRSSTGTTGAIASFSATDTPSNISAVATGSLFASAGTGTLPVWSASPTLTTSLTAPLVIGGTGTTSTLTLQSSSSGSHTTGADIIFKSGSTETMRILDNGNVGIGNNSPTSNKLNITSNTLVVAVQIDNNYSSGNTNTLQINVTANNNGDNRAIYANATNAGSGKAYSFYGNAGILYNSASVGFGLTLPTAYLHIKAGTATASTAPIKLTAGTVLATPEAGTVEYVTGAFVLQSDKLGIGNTSPTYDVDVLRTSNGTIGVSAKNASNGSSATSVIAVSNDANVVGGFQIPSSAYVIAALRSRGLFNCTRGMTLFTDAASSSGGTNSIILQPGGYAATPTLTAVAGTIGIGVTSPTSILHIKAGTATASTAPLKFTSGTNLTTAEAGAMEYDGTNLFFTRSGTIRESVICSNAVNSVSPTSQNRTITVVIAGTTYYLTAKTTND